MKVKEAKHAAAPNMPMTTMSTRVSGVKIPTLSCEGRRDVSCESTTDRDTTHVVRFAVQNIRGGLLSAETHSRERRGDPARGKKGQPSSSPNSLSRLRRLLCWRVAVCSMQQRAAWAGAAPRAKRTHMMIQRISIGARGKTERPSSSLKARPIKSVNACITLPARR